MDREALRRNRDSVDRAATFSTPANRPRKGDVSIGDLSLNLSGNWSSLNNSLVAESPASLSSSFGALRSTSSRSSLRAHRGPYSRPACLNQSLTRDNSRYTPLPLPKKTIFVGAKPVHAEASPTLPMLSTTAQKMMDILHRTATPVVQGTKVSINSPSLKSLKPTFMTQRQEGGPPIIRSTPDFGKDPQHFSKPGISSSTPNFPPNRINSSTNTPPEQSVEAEKSDGGGKMKTFRPNAPRTNLNPSSRPAHQNGIGNKQSSKTMVGLSRRGKRSFPFHSAAWPASKFRASLPTHKAIKASAPASLQISSLPLPALLAPPSEAAGATQPLWAQAPPLLEAIKMEPIPFSASNTKSKEWECPACMVFNLLSKPNCVCCAEPRPARFAPQTEAGDTEKAEGKPEPLPSPIFAFGFSAPPSVAAETPVNSSLFQFGAKTEVTDGLPKTTLEVTDAAPLKKDAEPVAPVATYTCEDCWVVNKMTDAVCVCCGGARPAKYASEGTKSSKPEPAKTAPAFRFGIGAPEPSFGGGDKDKLSTEEKPAFKFGLSVFPPPAETAKTESIVFGFGAKEKTPENPEPTPFKFGIDPKTPAPGTTSTPGSYLKVPGSFGTQPEKPPLASVSDSAKFSFEPFSGGQRKRKNADPVDIAGPKVLAFGASTTDQPVPTSSLAPTASLPMFNFGAPASTLTSTPVTSTSTPSFFGTSSPLSPPKASVDVPDQGPAGVKRTREATPEPNPKKGLFTFEAQAPTAATSAPPPAASPFSGFGLPSASAPPPSNLFTFGTGNISTPQQPQQPAVSTPFNFNAAAPLNLNFGGGGSGGAVGLTPAPPALFAFSASPAQTEGGGAVRRPIKKAHRRLK